MAKLAYSDESSKVLNYRTGERESNQPYEINELHASENTGLAQSEKRAWLTFTTYTGVLLFCAVYFFRPEDLFPMLRAIPFAKICGLITGIAFIAELVAGTIQWVPEVKLFLAFYAWICLAVPGSMYIGGSFETVADFSKVVLIIIAIMCSTTTLARLRYLICLYIASMLTLAILARGQNLQAGRLFGFGPMFGDPNDMALNFCIVLPFCVGFLLYTQSRFWKVIWIGIIVVFVSTIFATYSRGGFLALTAVCVSMVWRFKLKARTIVLLVILMVILCTVPMLNLGSGSYFGRLRTIADPQSDTTGSAQARQQLLIRSLEETQRHPVFGVGPGQFYLLSGDWHQSHNTYTQLTSECGIPSLILFAMLMWRSFKNSRTLEASQNHDQAWAFAAALQSAMVGFLVGGFFLGTTYWLVPYLLVAYSVAIRRIGTQTSKTTRELSVAMAET